MSLSTGECEVRGTNLRVLNSSVLLGTGKMLLYIYIYTRRNYSSALFCSILAKFEKIKKLKINLILII
jgi:hypothetical protein